MRSALYNAANIIDTITKASESLYRASGGEMYPAAALDGLFLSILKELK